MSKKDIKDIPKTEAGGKGKVLLIKTSGKRFIRNNIYSKLS